MSGSGLRITVTPEKFKQIKSTDEKLAVMYEAQLDQQTRCSRTIEEYDLHFDLCNGKIKKIDFNMDDIKKSIDELKEEIKNISIKRRKIDIGTGASVGAPVGIGIVEGFRWVINWFKHGGS